MDKKELYMIGNSHIDPVWFWNWEEGMQEVKATYASALERMKEYDDFKFTSTSTLFFEWIEGILPEMFEEIRQRVTEGRWEITGGWFLEPDCILPCGESFVRQGLYAQRYLLDRFGKLCTIGSNVDSFGHNHILPQILKKSGMDSYVFMRPRLDTPVFVWESDDGSRVNAISLPAEYTTWFHDPTVKNIKTTLERTKEYDKMPCCYGVGNHGGGPTIENINSIRSLQKDKEAFAAYGDVQLKFSTYTEFLEAITRDAAASGTKLPVLRGPFEKVNEGCYSIDSEFKRLNRLAESRLMEAETLMSMEAMLKDGGDGSTLAWRKQTGEMEALWKVLLFNEFHDTMGGTTVKSARDEAIMQLSGVCARAGKIKALAIQGMVNSLSTRGEGFPLVLFNTDSQPFDDYVEAELEWFCQAPLKLLGPSAMAGDTSMEVASIEDASIDAVSYQEIPYQRIHTDAKVRHTTLGGRRRFVFRAQVPAFGFAVYRTVKEEPSLCFNNDMELDKPCADILENEFICARFDTASGALVSLTDKETGYDALKGPCGVRVYTDERDAWGGLQGRRYEDRNVSFRLVSIEKVESGKVREVIRVRTAFEGTTLEQLYSLGAEEKELRVENRLIFNHNWTLLKAAFPTGNECFHTSAETAYGLLERELKGDAAEYYMQRFLDVQDQDGRGLAIANDGKYAFNMTEGRTQITLCRSAIYAQGNSPDWYNGKESYQYTDIGPQCFRFVLKPHGRRLPSPENYRIAGKINSPVSYLADSAHAGSRRLTSCSLAGVGKDGGDCANVRIMLMKKCEDDNSLIVRLLETEGRDTECVLTVNKISYPVTIGHREILTLKLPGTRTAEGEATEVNLLEFGGC